MKINKLSRALENAKKKYTTQSQNYNKFLENKNYLIKLNSLILSKQNSFEGVVNHQYNPDVALNSSNSSSNFSNSNGNFDENGNYNQDSNYGGNSENGGNSNDAGFNNNNFQNNQNQNRFQQMGGFQSPVNVVGGHGNGTPINIIAKNYINSEAIEEEEFERQLKTETKSHKLSKIPDKLLKTSTTDWEPLNYTNVDSEYDLYKLSKVKIIYDDELQKLMYNIIEPILTSEEEEILSELKKAFVYVFEKISFSKAAGSETELIEKGTKKLCNKYRIKLDDNQFKKITYYLERDFLGLELIEPIMHDAFIEDVSCDGLGVPIFVNHLKFGPIEVNRKYLDVNKLNSFIVKLAQKSNHEISLSKPILQGALTDGSRVEAIYGKEVSEKGSSFTIRKFRAEPFTPIHLIEFGTMPAFLLAYLWIAVENKQSILVSGGTATGKTTILNALSLFAPPTSKIVSIEDTPEINLPHEHWLPLISRESQNDSDVSMFDLLKASLRERPDYIIVGEIRGAEAAILFQGMATGHAGLGTVHADKFADLVNRMTIAPINLPKALLTELKVVVFMKQMKIKDNLVRRVSSVVEVIDYEVKHDKVLTNDFLEYVPSDDSFKFSEKSFLISNLLKLRGGKEDDLWTEIEKRRRILMSLYENKILEFKDVGDIFKTYYKRPSEIHDAIEKKVALRKK